ncbi:MYG1 family protein [Candidatus Parcubacteria bacterium]|nr:MYG1 family protein [Candidatus Parcubacteria bacterium]
MTKTINLVTHSGQFHADDIFSTALLNLYFKHKEPKTKLKYKRSRIAADIAAADIVYDVGYVYNPKKMRFDHHQNEAGLARENGVKYAAFGLVFKHFGSELIGMISGEKNKKVIADIFETVEKKLVQHIDGMDNGQLTYTQNFKGVDIFTVDNYYRICKDIIDTSNTRLLDKKFFELVKLSESMVGNVILYAIHKEKEKVLAVKAYKKSKDKRIIICDKFYNFNFNKFPEPLMTVYPDTLEGWNAKVVEKGEELYDARFYFPESWRGLVDAELEKACGVKGAKFCHKSGFLIVNKTKEGLMKMIDLALKK